MYFEMLKKLEQKICRYTFTGYVRAKLFLEKKLASGLYKKYKFSMLS
jgi:hypothetical protein